MSTLFKSAAQVSLLTISEEQAGQRIDNFFLRLYKNVPKSHLYRLLRSGQVRVNKGRVDQTYRLKRDDIVRIPPLWVEEVLTPVVRVPGAAFRIIFEDDYLLVIDKPAGVAVHGGSGVSYGVIEQLRAARPEAAFLELVHRLDRDTSGILLIAKKRSALVSLHQQIRDGKMDKRYWTLVAGEWPTPVAHVKAALYKYVDASGERRVRIQEDGQFAYTIFKVIKKYRAQYREFTLLEANLKTGRTHQIRVHVTSQDCVIAGDEKYGDFALNHALQKKEGVRLALKRMFLHAHSIGFMHPAKGESMRLHAPLPSECEIFLASLA